MSDCSRPYYVCHVYDRSEAQPHLGSFAADTRNEAMNAVCDALVQHRVQFSDEQLADATVAWATGERHFEFDEDGVSLAFFEFDRSPKK